MTMEFRVDKRVARDAAKWQRWSWSHRAFTRLMDPQRAARMQSAAATVAFIQQGQPAVPAAQPFRLSWWLGK